MVKIFKWIVKLARKINPDPVESYLASASDVYDLEYRMQQISRGQAPHQKNTATFWLT